MDIWMRVTKDKYSLPEFVASSVDELSQMCGASVKTIRSTISHYNRGKLKRERYVHIILEEDEENSNHGIE